MTCHKAVLIRDRRLRSHTRRTNDKVDLWAKLELERLVTHKVRHLDPFNDTILRNSLRVLPLGS